MDLLILVQPMALLTRQLLLLILLLLLFIAVQDVTIYSHLTQSWLSSALAMPRRTTAVARHTIADAL